MDPKANYHARVPCVVIIDGVSTLVLRQTILGAPAYRTDSGHCAISPAAWQRQLRPRA